MIPEQEQEPRYPGILRLCYGRMQMPRTCKRMNRHVHALLRSKKTTYRYLRTSDIETPGAAGHTWTAGPVSPVVFPPGHPYGYCGSEASFFALAAKASLMDILASVYISSCTTNIGLLSPSPSSSRWLMPYMQLTQWPHVCHWAVRWLSKCTSTSKSERQVQLTGWSHMPIPKVTVGLGDLVMKGLHMHSNARLG
jgi:hypothetical protein